MYASGFKTCLDIRTTWGLFKNFKICATPKTREIFGGGMRASAFFDTPQMTPIADKHGHHQYIHQRNDRPIHDEDKKAS